MYLLNEKSWSNTFKFLVLMYKVTLSIYYDLFSNETIMKEPKQRQ